MVGELYAERVEGTVAATSRKIDFLGCRLSLLSQDEVLEMIAVAVARRKPLIHAALNAGKVVAAAGDGAFRSVMNSFDVVTADGMSIVWASRLLGYPPVERITGIDLMQALLARAWERKYAVYFLGATDDVLCRMAARLSGTFPGLRVAGASNGYFSPDRDAEVVAGIAASGADILFVAMPTPKKEVFLVENRERLGVPFAMGVGGSFDVLAGQVARAPKWLQLAGMEWAFRLAQEPRRLWRRYLFSNTRFIRLVLRARLGRPFI